MDRKIQDDVGLGARGCVQEIHMCGDWKCQLEHPGGRRHLGGRAEDQGSLKEVLFPRN